MKQKTPRSTVAGNGGRTSQDSIDVNRYLYEQIYSELKEEILSGKYRKGDWFPPERVLKDRFGTTHLTVRNALAKLVLEGYIERYSGKGTLVIYARDQAAAARKSLSFAYVQVIFAGLDDANARVLEALESRFRKIPLSVHFSSHAGDQLLERSLHHEAAEKGALVILQPTGSVESLIHADPFPRNTILVRVEDVPVPCPRVLVDNALGTKKAVRYLTDLGHREIALCTTGRPASGDEFRRGFQEELASRGIGDGNDLVEVCAPGSDGGKAAVARILDRRASCRAFLCTSDETAASAIRGLRDAGLIPGVDCSVVGYGNTRISESMGLTTVDPGFERLAEALLSIVREGISRGTLGEEVIRIAPELRIRDSSTSARQ